MVGNRRKRSELKSKTLAVVPEEPEPLQIINAEAVNGPYDDELEKMDSLDSGVEPVYDGEYEEEEQMTDEINEEEFEINDVTSNGNEDVHTEDEEEEGDVEPVNGGSDNEDVNTEDEEEEEDEEPVSGGSDNEDMHTEEEEEVDEENEDNEEQEEDEIEEQEENELEEPDKDEVEEQEEYEEEEEEENEEEEEEEKEKDGKLASCGSDKEDVHTLEEVRADVTACITYTNEGLTSPEHVLVENLTDNLNDDKEANELMSEEPISIPAKNVSDNAIEEIATTAVEAKIVAEQGNQPKKKIIRRRLIKKNTSLGNEGSGVSSCKAETSNEPNLLCLEDNEAVGVESKEGKNEKRKNEKKVVGKPILKVNKKLNSIRKENQHGQSGAQTGSVEQKRKLTNNEPVSEKKETSDQEFRKEEVEKSEEANFTRKQKNKRIVKEGMQTVHAKAINEPESSKKGKLRKKVESQGMIFMCSSDTKKDCFRYKVFGLSAAKKDLVSKIYKGMRLFLFDVNLRMLYGIYKAAGPGSYDIEPRAFHSQFPSQVRFTVLKDCLPIPEGKFKKVIKDNYFTKKKFDCQLNKDQVKNLCKLFNGTAEKSAFKQGGPSQNPRPIDTPTRVDRKRKRVEDSRRVERRPISSQDPGRRRRLPEQPRLSGHTHIIRDHEEMRRPIAVRSREEPRLAPVVINERYRHPAVIYDRDAYLPAVESSALYKPYRAEDSPRSRTYSYERNPRIDHYRRESAIDYRDHAISHPRESRHYVQQTVHDPYTIYRESGLYHEPAYDSYPSSERRSSKYYRPAEQYRPLPERHRY